MKSLLDEDAKTIKKAMQYADCDMSAVKAWLKLYEKVKSQAQSTKESYEAARKALVEIQDNAKQLEELVVERDLTDSKTREQIQIAVDQISQKEGKFEHEFLIGKDNAEYHLTFDTLVHQTNQLLEGQKFIFQSEIENLIALNNEVLERPTPNFQYLGFYEIDRLAEELSDLPYQEKMRKIESLYQSDFIRPFRKQLIKTIEYSELLKDTPSLTRGWRGARVKSAFSFLLEESCEGMSIEDRANRWLDTLL